MTAVIPHQSHAVRRQAFINAVRAIKEKHEKRVTDILREIGNEAVATLRELTPKDTGAAAGTKSGAKRELYASHPARKLGLNIGNEVGDSGWQMKWVRTSHKFVITTPMWEPYLKYVNYTSGLNFVETAATQMRASLRRMKAGK